MKLTLRPIVKEDIDFIVEAENEYFHNYSTKDKIIEDLNNPLIFYYILVKDNILGYINLWIDEDKAQINSFVIVEKYRQKGYGVKMLDFIFDVLKEKNVIDLTLEVRPSNKVALHLYEKCGFKQISIRRAYYNNGEDAFFMYKRLGSG